MGHILHNMCFGDAEEFAPRLAAWSNLMQLTGADVLLCDHAPSALLAARSLPLRVALIGTGFCCPPAVSPWPNWRPEANLPVERLALQEGVVLKHLNSYLEATGKRPLTQLADLFADADATLLATFAELDHFPNRENANYLGIWNSSIGKPAAWPGGAGRRAFVYLKANGSERVVLRELRDLQITTLAYAPGLLEKTKQEFETATLRIVAEPLDIAQVASECDFAVLNAGHGATAAFLLAGKPVLLLPIYLEQAITTRNVVKLGAGLGANFQDPQQISDQLRQLLLLDGYRKKAEEFQARHTKHDAELALDTAVNHVLKLV